MNFDDDDLDVMVAGGRKVNGYTKPAPKEDGPEIKLLEKILKALQFQATRPTPEPPKFPDPKAPIVNVAAPEVTVAAAKPVTKWKFTLTKDKAGHTTEIIATAIE